VSDEPARTPVWDAAVRVLHWSLVLSLSLATLTTLGWGNDLHQAAGYVALAVVGLRLLWPLVGGARARHARFGAFVKAPRATWAYLREVLASREPRHLGHNPLGGWMIVALLATVIALAVTGWLYTTDAFWGDETVERIHTALAWWLLGLVVLHLTGVIYTSWRQRENLVAAMFSGRKRAPAPGDIED
jgi:cytochrome b